MYSSKASSISFNLIYRFRYLRFKTDALYSFDAKHPEGMGNHNVLKGESSDQEDPTQAIFEAEYNFLLNQMKNPQVGSSDFGFVANKGHGTARSL